MPSQAQPQQPQQHQPLPKLPVPTLDHTQTVLLRSSSALLSPAEMEQLTSMSRSFFGSNEAKKLHEALVNKAKNEQTSWLKLWWERAYVDDRSPIAINSNFVLIFGRDKPCDPISRAARLCCGAREFNDTIEANLVVPDTLQNKPLCMRMYSRVFRTCRVPGKERDAISTFDSGVKHMVVMRRQRFYKVDLYNVLGGPLSVAAIERKLLAVREHADKANAVGYDFSALTATNRDDWYKAREELVSLDPTNRTHLLLIESSLFVLCLDDRTPTDTSHLASLLLHGDGRSRYFDKSLVFVVFENGVGGLNAEHSPSDAPIPAAMVDYALTREIALLSAPSIIGKKTLPPHLCVTNAAPVCEITFRLNASLLRAVSNATAFAQDAANGVKVSVLKFTDYGANLIKKHKQSPDAWAQMAMQLAFFRNQGEFTATYETGSTRMFDYGRTETIRTCSLESTAWCRAMQAKDKSPQDKRALLLAALEAHRKYTNMATNAQGADRHMYGMRMIAADAGTTVPEFLTHPLVKRSSYFRLSTSNVTRKVSTGGGFGPVVPDGYGACYGLYDEFLQFMVSSFSKCPKTDAFKMSDDIAQALRDMADVMVAGGADNSKARSKL